MERDRNRKEMAKKNMKKKQILREKREMIIKRVKQGYTQKGKKKKKKDEKEKTQQKEIKEE